MLTSNQGAKYGYIWAGSNFVCGIFFFLFLPELKGRSLEEIDGLFERQIGSWEFKTATSSITEEVRRGKKEREAQLYDGKGPVELVEERRV